MLSEAQKSRRRLKLAQKALKASTNDEEREKLLTALHIAEVDNNYTSYCPLEWPYVSLYVTGEAQGDEGRARKGDPELWDRVEKAMEDRTLNQLKNELTVVEKTPLSSSAAKMKDEEEGEEDGDDGFFD